MKTNLLTALTAALILAISAPVVHAEAVVKKVCTTDAKTKKETCKDVKTHKKAEKVTQGSPDDPVKKEKKK